MLCYVCMFVRTYVGIYVCMDGWMYVRTYVRTYVCMCKYVHIYTYPDGQTSDLLQPFQSPAYWLCRRRIKVYSQNAVDCNYDRLSLLDVRPGCGSHPLEMVENRG